MVNTYSSSILKNPSEEKFRILKKTNKAIQNKLLSLEPKETVHDLLMALGYADLDDEQYAFPGNYFSVLFHGAYLIEDTSMEVKL